MYYREAERGDVTLPVNYEALGGIRNAFENELLLFQFPAITESAADVRFYICCFEQKTDSSVFRGVYYGYVESVERMQKMQ